MKFSHLLKFAWQMFRSRIFGNIIVILELTLLCVLSVIISNVINIDGKYARIVEASPYRMLYYAPPTSLTIDFSDQDSFGGIDEPFYEKSFLDKLDAYISQNDFVKGYQQYITSETAFSPDFMDGAVVQLLNKTGIEGFNLEISEGVWLNEADIDAEYIPAVIGGKNALKYSVGQKLTTYYIVNDSADSQNFPKNDFDLPYREYKLQIVGKLAYPELSPFGNVRVSGEKHPIGYHFTDRSVNDLFMFIPFERYSDAIYIEQDDFFVFYDRETDGEQLAELQTLIGNGYSIMAEQMVLEQSIDTEDNFRSALPFVFLALLIVLVGILSICILTTVSNMKKFRIYFLCGMSRKESNFVIFMSTIIFSAIASAVYGLITMIVVNIGLRPSTVAYLTPQPSFAVLIIILIFAIAVASFMLPAIVMSRTNVIDIIRNHVKE